MRRALLSLVALLATATMAASCLSPTLPLPPPGQPDAISGDSTGLWQIAGHCAVGASVRIVNQRTSQFAGDEDLDRTGTYNIAIEGKQCDAMMITQEPFIDSGDMSSPTEFVLQAWNNGMAVDPNACP
jgi:hypothetical protein